MWQLYQQHQKQTRARQQEQQALIKSINIISDALVAGQCEVAEGVFRIASLLNRSQAHAQWPTVAPQMHQFFDGIKLQPIGKARQHIAKQERMRHDVERMKLEAQYHEQVMQEVPRLKDSQTQI